MSTRQVTTCDFPGCPKEGEHFAFSRGTRPSGAGDSDKVDRLFDLCPGHTRGMLKRAMEKHHWEGQDEVIESMGIPLNPID